MNNPAHKPTTTHRSPKMPSFVSAPNIAHSAVGGAHYLGVPVTQEHKGGRTSSGEATRSSHESQEASRERIMNDLKELYCCRPTRRIFERTWCPDAVFEDPLVKAEGRGEYEPQWFAMPKIFSKSETISSRVMLSTESPNRLVYSQAQEYTLRFIGKKQAFCTVLMLMRQRIESVIVVDLDETDKITRMVEKWNGDELPTHYGAHFLRRANAQITPWLVKVPKE
ncbi:hypothetical protein PAXRUDRAFT_149512 [Paxillus rubicundulus Ve08.2h10]|uniref:Uncharacterized protein n=1 Tax=Paxillus rubicundulus Ve08.2h10 TaxID=930991 RepID=A0A0D0E3A4_9AGAM|nr:hypothetical protein PAXRUDRAFT_149512 [Paxillus rubicundulus Ve08.2h10]